MAVVIPSVTRLSPRVVRVLGCNPSTVSLQGTNTYLVGVGRRRILIDTGDADVPQYINHLRAILTVENIEIAHIIITHDHSDHIGGLRDVLNISDKTVDCRVWKYPRAVPASRERTHPRIEPLRDGQVVSVDGATLRVLHTPGHAVDHVSLYHEEEHAVFGGDCLLGEGLAEIDCLSDYVASLRLLLDLGPHVIYPGHGNVIANPRERLEYHIANTQTDGEEALRHVLASRVSRRFSETDLVKEMYATSPEYIIAGAPINVKHHLNKLLKETRVRKLSDGRWELLGEECTV